MADNATPAEGDDDGSELRRCRAWLGRLPIQDVHRLQRTEEFRDFLVAFQRLEQRHRCMPSTGAGTDVERSTVPYQTDPMLIDQTGASPLQSGLADEIISKVLDLLDSESLAMLSRSCVRLRALVRRSVVRRTADLARARQLAGPLEMLRAREQLRGVNRSPEDWTVKIPMLLPSRRVEVTGCGDPEFNGFYHCTGCSANGFVFTKPREPIQWNNGGHFSSILLSDDLSDASDSFQLEDMEFDSEAEGTLLRCIISKRFSQETILWYMSKEVLVTEDNAADDSIQGEPGDIAQAFCFWANLMVAADEEPYICRYPPQTSILRRNGDGWHALTTTRETAPPIVEIMD